MIVPANRLLVWIVTKDGVKSGATVDDVIIATAMDSIVPANRLLVRIVTKDGVKSGAAAEIIVPRTSDNPVIILAARNNIIAFATVNHIVSRPAVEMRPLG